MNTKERKYIFIIALLVIFIICGSIFLVILKNKNIQYKNVITELKSEIIDQNNSSKIRIRDNSYIMDKLQIHLKNVDKQISFLLIDNEVIKKQNSISQKLTTDGYKKSHLKISPNNSRLAFFSFLNNSKNKEIVDIDYDNYTSLRVINIDGTNDNEIYRGDYHTSNWEWLNDDELVVYRSCGSECMVGYIIDVNTAKTKAELQYGVGHEWSPDKELVLGYRYSGKYGITVGDKENNIIFSFRREHYGYSDLIDKTKAVWSPDSSKFALVIKKDNEEKLELLIFNVSQNFKQIFKSDIIFSKDIEMTWDNESKKLNVNNLEIRI